MIRLAALATVLCLSAGVALAEDFDAREGFYSGTGNGAELTATLERVGNDVYAVAFSTTLPMEDNAPGCGGGIEGEVTIQNNAGVLTAPNELYDATSSLPAFSTPQCQISLEFDDNYGLIIKEENGCTYYHGASCSFSGELLHDAAGI